MHLNERKLTSAMKSSGGKGCEEDRSCRSYGEGWTATGALAEWGCPTTRSGGKNAESISPAGSLRPPSTSNLAAIFVSLELSRTTWIITSLSPGAGEKMSKHSVPAGDVSALLLRFAELKRKAKARTGKIVPDRRHPGGGA